MIIWRLSHQTCNLFKLRIIITLVLTTFFFSLELARVSEEAAPVTSPVAPPVPEPQAPAAQSLSQSQPCRTEECERPAEQQPCLELPPEPCKVNPHVPMSKSILESRSISHISASLTGGFWVFSFTVNLTFCRLVPPPSKSLLISAFSSSTQKYLPPQPLSNYNKSPWKLLWQWTILYPSLQVCWHQ